MKYLVWILFITFSAPIVSAQGHLEIGRECDDIFYYMYRQADDRIKTISNVVLVCDTISISSNADVDSLLLQRGIFPDAEAYNLIYCLNPNLNSLRDLKSEKVIFPNFDQQTKILLENEQKENFQLICTTNYSIKDSIFQMIKTLNKGLQIDKKIRNTNMPRDQILAVFNYNDSAIDRISQNIVNRSSILNRRNLIQIREGISLIENFQKKDTINNADTEKLIFLKDDLAIMIENINRTRGDNNIPDPYPEQEVKINVVNSQGISVKGLRIYCVAKAFLDQVNLYEQFPMLSSPSVERLPIANYFIWAGKPGNSDALTDRYPLKLRKQKNGDPFFVQIVTK